MDFLNYINGVFVPAQSQAQFVKLSPFDGTVLGHVAQSDAIDLVLSLASSKKAVTASEKFSRSDRAQWLLGIAYELEKNAEELSLHEALHQGLPQSFVLENSVLVSARVFRHVAQDLLSKSQADEANTNLKFSQASAVGLIGVIAPWTLSLRVIAERLAPALAAGNAVIIKVSEQSPITGKILGEILTKAGVPAGLVNILQGKAEVAQAIAGHPSIRGISAVGRASTAEAVAKAAWTQFKKLQIHSGVKNAGLVLGETDFTLLMPEILKPFLLGQGQMGWNVSRLFILESAQAAFIEELKKYLSTIQPLKSPKGDSAWTPMISDEGRQAILEKIKFGQEEHGKIIWGGNLQEGPGFFIQPTVMLDLPNCSVLQQDEIHGPLLLVTPVKYQHEMAKWVNTSYLSQSAVIWGPADKAIKVAQKLDVASVSINSWLGQEETVVVGHKQSFFGIPDYRWDGAFFSEDKKVTGTI